MTLTFETMTRAVSKNYVCRIWRKNEPNYSHLLEENSNLKMSAETTLSHIESGHILIEQAILRIVHIERVSAVEIIDGRTGDGHCVYKDWP